MYIINISLPNEDRMKIKIVKQKNIDLYKIYIDGKESNWKISRQGFLTDIYYLVYYGKRLKRRCESMQECQDLIKGELLNRMADTYLN